MLIPASAMRTTSFVCILPLLLLVQTQAQETPAEIHSIGVESDGTLLIDSGWPVQPAPGQDPPIFEVESSGDLTSWDGIGTAHHWPFQLAVRPYSNMKFYRVFERRRRSSDDRKSVVVLPAVVSEPGGGRRWIGEPFFAFGTNGSPSWTKFTILLKEPGQPVVFQDSRKYVFHYDFARARIDGYKGVSRAQFDAVSLIPGDNQQLLLGAVLRSSVTNSRDIGIQFVGAEPYPIPDVVRWFHMIRQAVNSVGGPLEAYYMPVFEQSALSEADLALLEASNVPLDSPDRWTPGNGIYSEGWAMGRLVFVESGKIDDAFRDGNLLPTDILLTDGVPAEIPLVAGVIALSPATPNSHVAILARSFGVPFAYVRDPAKRESLNGLVGSEIYFAATELDFAFNNGAGNILRLLPMGSAPEELKAALLDLKKPNDLDYAAKIAAGILSAPTDDLTPEDTNRFGGKAANYGLLRRVIPGASRDAVAFSFDLWDGFLAQSHGDGTLGDAIEKVLEPHRSWPVANISGLDAALANVRDLLKSGTFSQDQRAGVIAALEQFDPSRKIRFRSSTNVEDSDVFVGAGLYDSFSGCLADDTDSDEVGPSACDPDRENERGVFRAIRKVFASFFNRNAYLERLRFGVDESEVGMAILAHHSFPDETELANGVAIVREGFGETWRSEIVTQLGAVSVANPEGNIAPEIVSTSARFRDDPFISLIQPSALVTTGDHVMTWQQDYKTLHGHLFSLYDAYRKTLQNPKGLELDFEFKKIEDEGIVVKQVRRIPPPAGTETAPFLLNTEEPFATFQGETFDGFFATHRMKSKWKLRVAPHQFDAGERRPLIDAVQIEYLDGDQRKILDSPVDQLPGYRHSFSFKDNRSTESWEMQIGGETVRWTVFLENVPQMKTVAKDVAVTMEDLRIAVTADFVMPQPEFVWDNQFRKLILGTTKSYRMTLGVDRMDAPLTARSTLQTRAIEHEGVSIETKFFWPPPPVGASAGYTAPAEQWEGTTITGLMPEPIVLTGFWSQTYLPGHHNFSESFMFEPALEEGVPQSTLDSLREKNVSIILIELGNINTPSLRYIGFDGKIRDSL